MGIGISIFLLASGAILAFAVDGTFAGLDPHLVGWILMTAGAMGLALFFYVWNRRRAPSSAVQRPQMRADRDPYQRAGRDPYQNVTPAPTAAPVAASRPAAPVAASEPATPVAASEPAAQVVASEPVVRSAPVTVPPSRTE
jgi:hypothetical protein